MSIQDTLIRAIDMQNRRRHDEAVRLFDEVLAVDPANPAALYSLGVIALNQGDPDHAFDLAERGVAGAPNFAPLHFLHGTCLQKRDRRIDALAAFDKAIALQPSFIEPLVNSGVLLRAMFRHLEALQRFNRVLEIDPNHAIALANCGVILTEFKQSREAIAMFERLITIDPGYDYALGLLYYERAHVCDWPGLDALGERIMQAVPKGERAIKSLAFMALSDRASEHLIATQTFARQYCPTQPMALWKGEPYRHEKIRLAYVSPDLREHPVGHLMAGIFEAHDKSKFETIAISIGIDDQSRLRGRMVNAFDRFIDARDMSAAQIARLMRELEVDIAVDLGGYTSDTRTEIFAHRPVPVQVNFLGYPGTMGADYFDYIVADRHVIPPHHRQWYTERVAYLPHTYLPTDASVQLPEQTPSRRECGLPEEGFVFCSFSHDYKISPQIFGAWMRLLQAVPGSVLWLMSRSVESQTNLRREAAERGIDPARLIFAGRVPRVEDHLARYRQADLFLDTYPYNAHTTAADALLAGLPVLTLSGQSFPSRVAGSLLHAIGLPELVTHSLDEYEALARTIARDPALLRDLECRIAANRSTHALFDTARFCRDLEAAFAEMHAAAAPALPAGSLAQQPPAAMRPTLQLPAEIDA